MRRKVLQDLANTLCDIVVSWRMGEDLERIAGLPDGALEFDLLADRVTHTVVGPVDLYVCGELAAWLKSRLDVLKIPVASLRAATLRADFRTDRIATRRKKIVSFDWECRSRLITDEKEYFGHLVEKHQWHTRVAAERRPTEGTSPAARRMTKSDYRRIALRSIYIAVGITVIGILPLVHLNVHADLRALLILDAPFFLLMEPMSNSPEWAFWVLGAAAEFVWTWSWTFAIWVVISRNARPDRG